LHGLLVPGDRVVTSGIEHNSVMRPLRSLESAGVEVVVVPCAADGSTDLDAMRQAIVPGTTLVVVNHASNVVGTLSPVGDIARLAHSVGALCVVDAAQTAGVLPIDVQALGIDVLAFTGHKGLLGPTGTGGMAIAPHLEPERFRPAFCGGTGSRSEEELPPEVFPDRLEPGTPNGVGIAGLGASVLFLLDLGIDEVRSHEVALTERLVSGLLTIPGVKVYGPASALYRTATVSVRIDGLRVSDVGWRLDEDHDILTLVGLHCSPAAHRTLGTFPEGTVRLSAGLFTTERDIDATLVAVSEIAASYAR